MAKKSPKAKRPAKKDVTSSAKPAANFRYGNVSAAVFTNKVKKGSDTFDVYSVSVRRSYRTPEGQWVATQTLRKSDLLPASYALQKCYEFVNAE